MIQKTQLAQIRAHLESGKSISPLYALKKFGCFRLADIVFKLKKAKPPLYILTTMVNEGKKHYARYSMAVPNTLKGLQRAIKQQKLARLGIIKKQNHGNKKN